MTIAVMLIICVIIAVGVISFFSITIFRNKFGQHHDQHTQQPQQEQFNEQLQAYRSKDNVVFTENLLQNNTSAELVLLSLLRVLALPAILVDNYGKVLFMTQSAQQYHLVEQQRIINADIERMIMGVRADHTTRKREILDHCVVTVGEIVPQRTIVLLRDVSDIRKFERARRDFITNISHELKTPTGAISLLAETLQDAQDDTAMMQYCAERMEIEAQRLQALVMKVLELEHSEFDSTHHETAELTAAVAQVVEMVGTQATLRDVSISVAALSHGEHIDIQTLPALPIETTMQTLVSLIHNLVENAVRYSNEHTNVQLTIEALDNNQCRLRVIDQGIGIAQAELPKIFERFYRVDTARSRSTGGSGLGLSIVQSIIKSLHGDIHVWSQVNSGTTFTVTLPIASSTQCSTTNTSSQELSQASISKEQTKNIADET